MDLLRLKDRHSDEELVLRVSIDHYEPTVHESERGANSWSPMIDGINWLRDNNFMIKIAGRRLVHESLGAGRRARLKSICFFDSRL